MQSSVQAAETLPALQNEHAPQNFAEMWAGLKQPPGKKVQEQEAVDFQIPSRLQFFITS
jgi:hypothetical protein